MNSPSRRSMRRELRYYVLGLTLLTAIAFAGTLIFYYEDGLDKATQASILMEARNYEERYREDNNTPLPQGYTIRLYLDDLTDAPKLYQQLFDIESLIPYQLEDYEWTPSEDAEWENARFLGIYLHILPDGRKLYAVADYRANLFTEQEIDNFDKRYRQVFIFTALYILLMLLAVWFHNRRISRHTSQLANWAESLGLERCEPPNFRYSEMQHIAEQLSSAFQRIARLLDREHQFLRHASHELRTPIAITRANMELLNKVGVPQPIATPIERIARANQSMQQLTETLLWLSRESEAPPSLRSVNLCQLLDCVSEELQYLLQTKTVTVKRDYAQALEDSVLAETPLRIVLSNLVRNAYQYTAEGEVLFTITQQRLIIENIDTTDGEQPADQDHSFGLGLMLANKICERLGWQLLLEPNGQGMRAELLLTSTGH